MSHLLVLASLFCAQQALLDGTGPNASERQTALERALPLSRLRTLNPTRGAEIDALVARSGREEGALRYLPLRGPAGDGAVLIDSKDAAVIEVTGLVPW